MNPDSSSLDTSLAAEPIDRRSATWARFAPRRDLRPSDAVVDAVAAAEGCDPRTVSPPVDEALDTDALNALFSDGSTEAYLSFRYAGYVVDVHGDGWVRVRSGGARRSSGRPVRR